MRRAHFIVGCGYTGLVLARDLVAKGERVVGTTRDPKRMAEIAATGAEPLLFSLERDSWPKHPFKAVYLLATVPREPDAVIARMEILMQHLGRVPTVAVASTGLYGQVSGIVDEMTLPCPQSERERCLALWDASILYARQSRGIPISVARTPAIYGPGRCFENVLRSGDAKVIDDGPITSRIHVDDLSALLQCMVKKGAPPILLACDNEPAPTSCVMDEAANRLGLSRPRRIRREASPAFLWARTRDEAHGPKLCFPCA